MELFTKRDIVEFIINHKSFIDNNPYLFDPNILTKKPASKYVFDFGKLVYPNCPDYSERVIYGSLVKNLTKVRVFYKRYLRYLQTKLTYEEDYSHCIGSIFEHIDYIVIKVVKTSAKHVFFKYVSSFEEYEDIEKIIWSKDIKWMTKETFKNKIISKKLI